MHLRERKKILWLASWYPNKYDAFDGDFIQRHAKAAALIADIHVLFVKQDERQAKREGAVFSANGLTEQIIYLPKRKGLVGRLRNFLEWKREFQNCTAELINAFQPVLVHVHVLWKAGLIALWAKRKFGLPYAVTEHWGIYNTVVEDNIHTKPFFVRRLLKKIYAEASCFISVSRYLGQGVNETLVKKEFEVMPNVVDTSLFRLSAQKHERFTFIHVSNTVPLKNVGGILRAFKQFLSAAGTDAQLVLIGNKDRLYETLAQELKLPPDAVVFKGEVPYADVAAEMRKAHVFVLNSDIENSPCVIGEALCCGLPVVATHVGGIPELVSEENGLLVPPGDDEALCLALQRAYKKYQEYKLERMANEAQARFSPAAVSTLFEELYRRAVERLHLP